MRRLVIVMLGTIVAVLFSLANSHHVNVSLIFGAPVRIRMIFVIAGAYCLGIISTIIFEQWQRVRRKRDFEEARQAASAAEEGHRDITDV